MISKNQTRSFNNSPVYLDYAASTPVAKEVLEAMEPYFRQYFGNAGSIHRFGQKAQAAIDKAREVTAKAIGAKFNEIIFTGSATEANNLALLGAVKVYKHKSAGISTDQRPRIIISSIEHESVLDTAKDLEKEGVEVIYLPVDKEGFIDSETVRGNLTPNTVLVSIIYASNETGTIEPIAKIGKVIKEFRGVKIYPLFHTDAAQAFQFLDCGVGTLGVDLMTISGQKIYGPKGIGVLYVRNVSGKASYNVEPVITGGGQEYGLRSGTENVPAIVGFGRAVEFIEKNKTKEAKRIKSLRDYFWQQLKTDKKDIGLNGPPVSSKNRLPNNLNIYFAGHDSEDLLIKLDLKGVAVSAGSACSARSTKPSYVISALNLSKDRPKSSLRISLGRPTTKKEVDISLERIINLLL